MNNTTTTENIEHLELNRYEIEQPIAAMLGDFTNTILHPGYAEKKKSEQLCIEHMSANAAVQMEYWSRDLAFLIWKVSTSDNVCKQSISSMGTGAEILGSFASMVQPLNDLSRIEYLKVKANALEVAQSKGTQTDTSSNAALEAKAEALTMLGDLESMVSTSMHRVMDGLENENPVSTDTLIGLFSGMVRNTVAISEMVEKIDIR